MGGEDARGVVRDGKTRDLGIIKVCHQTQHPAQCLTDGIEAWLISIGAALAVTGDRAVDQFGIELRQLFIIEAEALSRGGSKIFNQDIRCRQKPQKDLSAPFLPQIECDAFLVSVQDTEAWAVSFIFGVATAVRVAAVGQFDFDDLATEIAEQAARIWPGHVPAYVDSNGSFERSGDHGFFTNCLASQIGFSMLMQSFQ